MRTGPQWTANNTPTRPGRWPMLTLVMLAAGWALAFVGAVRGGWWALALLCAAGVASAVFTVFVVYKWQQHRRDHPSAQSFESSCAVCAFRVARAAKPTRLPSSQRWWVTWAVLGLAKAGAGVYGLMWWWPAPVAVGISALIWLGPLIVYGLTGHRFETGTLELLEDLVRNERPPGGLPTPEI